MELKELLLLDGLPAVRFPPFSKTLHCYENCTTEPFKPFNDGIEKYISNAVDLKLEKNKSFNDYKEFIDYITDLSITLHTKDKNQFKLHLTNEVEFGGNIQPIDKEFEILFFDVLTAFNQGQPFVFEFQYKIDDPNDVNISFLHRLTSYLKDNHNMIFTIWLGEIVTDELSFGPTFWGDENWDLMNFINNRL